MVQDKRGQLMRKLQTTLKTIACAVIACSSLTLWANQEKALEEGLVNALRLKNGTSQRMADSGAAIQGYMRADLVGKKPNQRADYTDYYLVKNSSEFMGHDLLLIEEEYMTKYIGCCVSPGAGVTVKVNGSTSNLVAFARQNKCSFTDNVNIRDLLAGLGIKSKIPAGRYATLSCRERDTGH